MDCERIRSAPEERQSWSSLSITESVRSVSSEPSRLEEDEDFLSDSGSDSFHSSSTGDVCSLADDGSLWSHEAAVPRGPVPVIRSSAPSLQQPTRSQQLQRHNQIRLRRQIDHLNKRVAEKEYQVEQSREQLLRCREHLSSLLDECATLEREEREREGPGGVAARGMLRARLAKVRAEIAAEEAVEKALQGSLQQAELGLAEAQLTAGKINQTAAHLGVSEEEGLVQETRDRQAMKRLQTRARMMVNAERSLKAQERLYRSTLEMQEEQTRAAIEKARQAQLEGRRFLQETLGRQRKKEAEEGVWHRAHLEQRMKAMLSLKGNIEASQGTMQAQQNLQREKERQQKRSEVAERERILVEGGNPDQELLKRQRVEGFKKKRESFEHRQRERQVAIVARLLEEAKAQRKSEKKMAKAHWQQAPHHGTRHLHRQKLRRRRQRPGTVQQSFGPSGEAPAIRTTNDDDLRVGKENRECSTDSSDEERFGVPPPEGVRTTSAMSGVKESLAEPEIPGLWEDGWKEPKGTEARRRGLQEEGEGEGGGGKVVSKLEQEMMQTAMEKLRKNVVVRQVAAGREFKGCAFISKPEEVVFRDFDVGRSYRRRVQLTNISYSVNHCKLVGLSQCLRNFISVDFEPPGSMSAGLTCHMTVTFEPKLNEDLAGEVAFLSQTGPFSVPVRCLTKKCVVSLDKTEVEFGRVCIGETIRRHVTLSNSGALPTKFWFAPIAEKPSLQVSSESAASGQPPDGPPAAGDDQLSDRSAFSIMTTMEASIPREDLLAMRQQLQSRSVGDLCGGLGQKSLTWDDQKAVVGTTPGEGGEREKEARDGGSRSSRRSRRGETTDVKTTDEGGETVAAEAHQEAGIVASKSAATSGEVEGEAPGDQVQEVSVMMVQSEAALSELEITAPPAIKVGKVSEGTLAPFSSLTLELLFSPEIAGSQSSLFQLSFQHPSPQPMTISASGQGVELPVFVERETVEMRICLLNRLYQDSLVIHNRAATALRVTFEVPPSLQPHLEILPRHGLVQGEDSFAAQLKFMPRDGIFTDGHKYLVDSDSSPGQLEIPLEIRVANQTRPVPFTLRAQVTVSDIEFGPSSIDFGSCTVHESVVASLQLTNKSLLPQEFGFVHLPEVVEVQPNDGFGTLLPWESHSLDVIFSAKKAMEYDFDITCKTATDRTFKLPCRGVGILPPLQLSANTINFAPTAVNDTRTATLTIRNPKLSRLNSAVIRGAVLPQGPKAFELAVPGELPIAVSPRVGVVPLGQSVSIQVQFSPRLDAASIREEATKLASLATPPEEPKQEGQNTSTEQEGEEQPSPRKKAKRPSSRHSQKSSRSSSSKASLSSSLQATPAEVPPPSEGSDLWCQASLNLLSSYKAHCLQVSIPCFVSSEDPGSQQETVAFRPEDTLYLEVTAPVVRPALVLISDSGRTTINFGNVGTGDTATKVLTLQNISQDSLNLTSSLLDPHGPFELRNALRELSPSATHNAILRFSPQQGGKYYEPLQFRYGHASSLELRLTGEGVEPSVSLCLEGEVLGDTLDVGHAFARDTVTKALQLRNDSSLGVAYRVSLESAQPNARKRRTGHSPFRASNCNGQPPFNCVPFQGTIDSGKSAELSVTFSPDHQSAFYTDMLLVEINGQQSHSLRLKGSAWSNNVYPLGGEPTSPGEESMAAVVPPAEGQAPPPSPILVMFVYHMGEEEGGGASVSRELEIGCIKTPLVKKNSGDYVIESIPSSNPHAKAFSIDPMKSSVEAGSSKTVTLTFRPPKNSSMQTVEATTNLILKGDTVQTYKLLLRGALSCVGSLLIIFSYWRWKDIRTGSRSVITFLAIADFFTAFGYIIGSINHITYYGKYDDTPPCATFLQICEVQSYITTWSSLSSFTWTCALAIYLYFTVVRKRIVLALKMIPVFHVIAWGVPIAICLPLLIEGKLGYTPYAVSTWCFIGDSNPSGHSGKISAETVGLVFLAGKGAEIFTYILVTVLYIAIKYHIWKETREARRDFCLSQTMVAAVQSVDRKLLFIPMIFILLRMWGTLQFFYSLIISKHLQCGCVPTNLHIGFLVFGYLHAVGDGGQGWGNAVLYIFASTKIRDRMFGWLYKPILRAILWCLRGNVHPNHQTETRVERPLTRQKLQQGRDCQSVNPDLHVAVESQSAHYKLRREGGPNPIFLEHEPTTEFTTQLNDY